MPLDDRVPPTALIVQAPDQLSTELDDEVVLLSLRRGRYFGLDGVGARVWELLGQPRTFEALLAEVVAEYDVERETAAADLTVFLRRMEAGGLVEIRPPAP